MSENMNATPAETVKEKTKVEDLREKMREEAELRKEKSKEANMAIASGAGRLQLEKPIISADKEITELIYDFNELTGMDMVNAMDSDSSSLNIYKITYKQSLALFAAAAARQTPSVDSRDIIERIGGTDALEGVQLAVLFFNASTRAGRLRISKK
ncbi:MAG: hypothetical protein Q4B26_03195 [Eubacteriales bacterium]|nr:hypothetical protein [Eubacteriales bacterium]